MSKRKFLTKSVSYRLANTVWINLLVAIACAIVCQIFKLPHVFSMVLAGIIIVLRITYEIVLEYQQLLYRQWHGAMFTAPGMPRWIYYLGILDGLFGWFGVLWALYILVKGGDWWQTGVLFVLGVIIAKVVLVPTIKEFAKWLAQKSFTNEEEYPYYYELIEKPNTV